MTNGIFQANLNVFGVVAANVAYLALNAFMRGNITAYTTSKDTDFTTTIVNGSFDAWKIAR